MPTRFQSPFHRATLVAALGCVTLACGSGQTTTPTEQDCSRQSCPDIWVELSFNGCPELKALLVSPTQLTIGENAHLEAEITDPDGDAVSWEWSASAGSFSGADAVDTYTCTSPGQQVLTLWYFDARGCVQQQSTELFCAPR